MTDRDFLIWIHERLEHVHGESPILDFMHKLRAIILSLPAQRTTTKSSGANSLHKLQDIISKEICTCKGFYKPKNCPKHGR